MLSFDDFSIKRKYKEKTVRTIKISLEFALKLLSVFLPGWSTSFPDQRHRYIVSFSFV